MIGSLSPPKTRRRRLHPPPSPFILYPSILFRLLSILLSHLPPNLFSFYLSPLPGIYIPVVTTSSPAPSTSVPNPSSSFNRITFPWPLSALAVYILTSRLRMGWTIFPLDFVVLLISFRGSFDGDLNVVRLSFPRPFIFPQLYSLRRSSPPFPLASRNSTIPCFMYVAVVDLFAGDEVSCVGVGRIVAV